MKRFRLKRTKAFKLLRYARRNGGKRIKMNWQRWLRHMWEPNTSLKIFWYFMGREDDSFEDWWT